MDFTVDNLGVETYHSSSFCHELPEGFPLWMFYYAVTPCRMNLDGEMRDVEAGSCIIYPPNHPRYLYAAPGADNLINTWCHFRVSDEEEFRSMLVSYGIPVLSFFALERPDRILPTLRDLVYEVYTRPVLCDSMINSLMHVLMIEISRNALPVGTFMDKRKAEQKTLFEELRRDMYSNPEREWLAESMAARVFLGKNRFISLYSEFFGATPKHDLLEARIGKARSLLSRSSNMQEVAEICGFQNEYYFSRMFKKKTGMTPGQYVKAYK